MARSDDIEELLNLQKNHVRYSLFKAGELNLLAVYNSLSMNYAPFLIPDGVAIFRDNLSVEVSATEFSVRIQRDLSPDAREVSLREFKSIEDLLQYCNKSSISGIWE